MAKRRPAWACGPLVSRVVMSSALAANAGDTSNPPSFCFDESTDGDRCGRDLGPNGAARGLFKRLQIGDDVGAILGLGQPLEEHLGSVNVAARIGEIGIE